MGLQQAAIDQLIAEEFRGLQIHWTRLAGRPGAAPTALERRLAQLANGYRGANVVSLRTRPVPAAYRSFFRQIGLDPDQMPPPAERAALRRLFDGTFRSEGLIEDALLVALLETGVPLYALDAARVRTATLELRQARSNELLETGRWPTYISEGTLVLADADRVHTVLFGDVSAISAVTAATEELLIYAVAVQGVPAIHVEEAFWIAEEALAAGS